MTNFKTFATWTLVLNVFIIVVAGHGVGCLGLIEIFWLPQFYGIGTEDFSLSLASSYDKTLGLAAILSLFGQIIFLFSFVAKGQDKIFWIRLCSLLLLWTGFFYLTHNLFDDSASMLGFVTGLPFFIVSIILAIKIVRKKLGRTYG